MNATVLFMTSNGAGLGHLTRLMAIARRMPTTVSKVFFTLSRGANVAIEQGFYVEYMASVEDRTGGGRRGRLSRRRWNQILRDRLIELLALYEPNIVLFDGTYPYNGLLAAMDQSPRPIFIWCRRGMWRRGLGHSSAARADCFHSVIEPGDFAADFDHGVTKQCGKKVSFPPVWYLDESELLEREAAVLELGLDPGRLCAFVQLGAGNINEIGSLAGRCVRELQRDSRVQIVFADSTISRRRIELEDDLVRVREYPLSRYARAFDLAVTAAGYNTYHELMSYRVPSLFVPNTRTKLDDQAARARYAEAMELGLSWQETDTSSLESKIRLLLDDRRRSSIKERLADLEQRNGADEIARHLTTLLDGSRKT